MKREHVDDDERRRDRSPDVKRQRPSDGHYQQQRRPQSNDSYRHQQRSNDSYSRRDDRYLPPRRPDSISNSRDHRTRRDTPTPYERRVSAHELDTGAVGSSSYVAPAVAASDNNAGVSDGSSSTPGVRLLSEARESDSHRLAQRQKQIDYGKNTVGYDRYCAAVPRHQRRRHVHPVTPDRTLNVSKKAFDGMIRKWRQALHKYDPPELQNVSEEQQGASAVKAVSPGATTSSSQNATSTGAIASSSSVHDADMAELDPERYAVAPASTASSSAPTLSIFENFVEGDLDDDDDDLL